MTEKETARGRSAGPDPDGVTSIDEAAARRLAALPDASIILEGVHFPSPPEPIRVELDGTGRLTLHQGSAVIEVGALSGLIDALQKARWIRDEAAKLDAIPHGPEPAPAPDKVVDLMDALERSVAAAKDARTRRPRG